MTTTKETNDSADQPRSGFLEHFRSHRFDLKHVTVLFVVLLFFQLVVSILHKTSLSKFLGKTQEWYQQDSAERLANLTTTSLELLLEGREDKQALSPRETRKMVQGLNIILNQQLLNQNVREICVIVPADTGVVAIDDGNVLYSYMFEGAHVPQIPAGPHAQAIARYRTLSNELRQSEQIRTIVEGRQTFHVFVPFVPRGEYMGALYMRNTPDFSFISREVISNYDEISLTFSALILFGLLAMFFISSYTLKQRNDAQQLLFAKEKELLTEQIHYEKELLFTKRIYHTHHKAEKVMGFIKEDLRTLSPSNMDDVKHRIIKYSNFIARVIYDMKWFDPPVQTIRSPMFRTDINEVIRFLVNNVFQRVTKTPGGVRFSLTLAEDVPPVHINEFVVWESLEPIIQNCVEHGGVPDLEVHIITSFNSATATTTVVIEDNGIGLAPGLLTKNERGVRKVFLESVSTKNADGRHSGYGCYLAHEIVTQRCGWLLDAENRQEGGARFIYTIPNGGQENGALSGAAQTRDNTLGTLSG
jgi:hypothetical protein